MATGSPAAIARLNRYARLAGGLYLIIILSSLLSLGLIESRLVVAGDPAATVARIAAQGTLFRAGLVYDLVMFAGVVALAWALYVIVRDVARNQALLALLWRLAEAIVGAGTVLLGALAALLIENQAVAATFAPGQLASLVTVLLDGRAIGLSLVLTFLSLGTLVYCRLFYVSGYVPRALAGLGIAAFMLMLAGSLASLISPELRDLAMLAWTPGIVFEVAIGAWLLVKGLRLSPPVARDCAMAPAAAVEPAAG